MRQHLQGLREGMSPQVRAAANANLVTWITRLGVAGQPEIGPDATIAAHVPIGTEPGSVAMLEALRDQRHRVLLPIVGPGDPSPLSWAGYDGPESLTTGRFGLLEPAGAPQPGSVINSADLILVPALAVDRSGNRLGRGAGYYDRSLQSIDTKRLVAVVYDHEVLDEIPGDALDVPMGWSLTPSGGFHRLGTT
ncbi:UNVERIFIED_CONTAM: 5-formyltetrahydrofolate cyclo-ligase [Williamsia faeni]